MMQPRITKVAVNIGVGEGGNRLINAEKVLELVTGVRPQRTLGRIQNRDLKVRQGAPIGCKVTLFGGAPRSARSTIQLVMLFFGCCQLADLLRACALVLKLCDR